jgi:hypothetical protein
VAGTTAFVAVRSVNVFVLMVATSIASLKVAVTVVPALTPVAPSMGVVEMIVGGVTSPVEALSRTIAATEGTPLLLTMNNI